MEKAMLPCPRVAGWLPYHTWSLLRATFACVYRLRTISPAEIRPWLCRATSEEQWIPLGCQECPLQGWPRKASSRSSLRKPTAKSQSCSSGLWEPLWSTATRETDVNRAKPLRSEEGPGAAFSQVPGAGHSGFSKQNPYSETGSLDKN